MVINPIVGVYIPIIRIPIKGWMTIPNTRSLDPGSYDIFKEKLPQDGKKTPPADPTLGPTMFSIVTGLGWRLKNAKSVES